MSNNAMSNETDLDWLARNVHVWPAGDHQPWCYVYWKGGQRAVSGNCITAIQPCVRVEMSEWLARRAELQNRPVTVTNETVQLEQPISATGTGNGSAAESAFLIGRVIDLLRTSVDHFSANELADLHQLCNAELTKRDAAVCGGQKYLDANWFERGELPPVGVECLYVVSDRLSAEVEITAHAKFGLCFVEVGKSGENYVSKTAELHRFRPIPTERDVLIEIIKNADDTDDKIADAILAAGFSLRGK